jgi:putative ABC transport system permease protein
MAIGADQSEVLKLVVKQSMTLVLIGTASGVMVALLLTRLVSTWLYEVHATDPATFAGVALLLVFVGLLASYFPARRATKVDPMVALRYE